MTYPVLTASLNLWICDRPPTDSEPNLTGYINYTDGWWDKTSGRTWISLNDGTWGQEGIVYTNTNLNWSEGALFKTDPPQYQPVSLALNTARQPSTDYDIEVIASIILSSTLVTSESVNIQVDGGGGYVTIASLSLSGVIATSEQTVSFRVPIGQSYKIVTTSGSPAIGSIYELSK